MEKSPSGFEPTTLRAEAEPVGYWASLVLRLSEFSRIGLCVLQQRTDIY
jgi:hypothetical protein